MNRRKESESGSVSGSGSGSGLRSGSGLESESESSYDSDSDHTKERINSLKIKYKGLRAVNLKNSEFDRKKSSSRHKKKGL